MAINILDMLNSDTVFGIPQQYITDSYYKTDTGVGVDENLPVEGAVDYRVPTGMPSDKQWERELKETYLRTALGNDMTARLLEDGNTDKRLFVLRLLSIGSTGETDIYGNPIWMVRPYQNIQAVIDTEGRNYFEDSPFFDEQGSNYLPGAEEIALTSLFDNPQYGKQGSRATSKLISEIQGKRENTGLPLKGFITDQFAQDLSEGKSHTLAQKEAILNKLTDHFGGDDKLAEQVYNDTSTRSSVNAEGMLQIVFTNVDPTTGRKYVGSDQIINVNMPDPDKPYVPVTTFSDENRPATTTTTAAQTQPFILWNTETQNTEFLFPDKETGQFVMPTDPNLMLYDVAEARGLVTPADPTVQVPFGPGPDDTYGISPDTYFTQSSADERSRQALLAEQAQLEETNRNNNLIEASKRARLAQEQAQFQANMAESQGQFDRSLALNSFAQQSRDEATRIEAELEMSRQNIDRLNQITTALSRPSDAVAASFALTGNQSPMGIFTQADAINPYIADMMDRRSAIEAFGPGFQAEDFMEGRGNRQNPLTNTNAGSGALGPNDIVKVGDTDADGNTLITYGDGRQEPLLESSQGVSAFEHGGHSFGNPIVVGDSSKNEENQELVMSFGNAPMVVLPLNEQQEKIMERANSSVPRAENGGLTGSGMMGGDLDQTMAMDINPDHIFTNEDDPTGALRFAQDIQLGGTGRAFDPTGQFRFALGTNPQGAVDSGPGTTAPRAGGYSTRDYAIGGQPMNQGTISSQQAAFAPTGRQARMGNPGLAGFESMYPLTQGMIQDRSDMLASPRVRQVLQGTAGEGSFRQRPTQMPFALPTPGFMRNLTGTEREFLKSNLATRNIFLDDVETAVSQRFGRTNTSQGRRRFN
jgi:hypothetical protein